MMDATALAYAPPDDAPDSIEALYDRYAGVVFSLALRIVHDRTLAEEILEEVVFRAWQQLEKRQVIRGTILTWLTEMTRAMAIEAIFDRPASTLDQPAPRIGLTALDVLADPRVRETRRAVSAALTSLPPGQRRAIELAYFEGLTEDEIATAIGIRRETVRSWLRDAVRLIGEARPRIV